MGLQRSSNITHEETNIEGIKSKETMITPGVHNKYNGEKTRTIKKNMKNGQSMIS